jgi:hypothetical protein
VAKQIQAYEFEFVPMAEMHFTDVAALCLDALAGLRFEPLSVALGVGS